MASSDLPRHLDPAPFRLRASTSRCLPLFRTALLGLFCAALCELAAAAAGDDPSGLPSADAISDTLEVRLVDLEAVVTDRGGDPVAGLAVGDFTVEIDGEPATLSHFAAYRGGRLADSAGLDGTAAAGPLTLAVYLDRAFLSPDQQERRIEELVELLNEGALGRPAGDGPGADGSSAGADGSSAGADRLLLFVADRELALAVPPTADPAAIAAHLASLEPNPPRGRRLLSEERLIVRDVVRQVGAGVDPQVQDPAGVPRQLLARISAFAGEADREVAVTVEQLSRAVDALAGLPGRRQLLYIGGRVPADSARQLVAVWQGAFGRGSGRIEERLGRGATGSLLEAGSVAAESLASLVELRRLAVRASARGVRIHTLAVSGTGSLAGLAPGGNPFGEATATSGSMSSAVRAVGRDLALADLAALTGGRNLAAGRRLAGQLEELGGEQDTYYVLGVSPPPEKAARGLHRLEIGLTDRRHRRLAVRHPRVLLLTGSDQRAAERTISALMLSVEANELGVELTAGDAVTRDDGAITVPLLIRIPFARIALLPEGGDHVGRLSLFVSSGDFARGAEPVEKAVLPVRVANDEVLTALGREVEYRLEVTVRPGADLIAVTVRDDYASSLSTATLPLASGSLQAELAPPAGDPPAFPAPAAGAER